MNLNVVILAAGQGKRMHSEIPKVLHLLAGKPLLEHVIQTATQLVSSEALIVVHGQKGEIPQFFNKLKIQWVLQNEPLGTGHALQCALPYITSDHVLILYGDVPLITAAILQELITQTPKNSLGMITAEFPEPRGLGRILRDSSNHIIKIIEDKDATAAQKNISEINSGIYFIPLAFLKKWLPAINNQNVQKEYYLTDIVALAANESIPIYSIQLERWQEVLSVNDCLQLSFVERFYQTNKAQQLMQQGVTFSDPNRFDLRGELHIGQDVLIDINVILEGQITIGNHCSIGANVLLRNTELKDYVQVKPNSIIDGAIIAEHCVIGPFARIRPETVIAAESHIGNFVEIKKSKIGYKTKINHLSYIGDSVVGNQVNIGAGTITCNYDGVNKHQTHIGDHAFIGSNTELIAPVTIGEGATIGAGSTITKDAPPYALTLARVPQCTIQNWKNKKKE